MPQVAFREVSIQNSKVVRWWQCVVVACGYRIAAAAAAANLVGNTAKETRHLRATSPVVDT